MLGTMNKRSLGPNHLKFLLAGVFLAVMLDYFVSWDTRHYIEQGRQEAAIRLQKEAAEAAAVQASAGEEEKKEVVIARLEPEIKVLKEPEAAKAPAAEVPQWKKNAVPVVLDPDKPKVVIVIDDLGVARSYSKEVLELPGPLTLSFLPYAEHLGGLVKEGRKNGHEIMVHMPMEPMNPDLDMGSIYLSTEEPPEVFDEMLQKGLKAFGGYVGMNNHMGSRLTQDKDAMRRVMVELHKRGLLFLDSRTIAGSVGAQTAKEYDVPYASRDVFLDDDPSLESVRKSLEKVERVARDHGQAIAIGHPKPNTIAALQEWLPTLAEKGFQLVPVSAVVVTKTPVSVSQAAAPPAPAQSPAPPRQ